MKSESGATARAWSRCKFPNRWAAYWAVLGLWLAALATAILGPSIFYDIAPSSVLADVHRHWRYVLMAPALILGIVLSQPLVALNSLFTGPGGALADLAYFSMLLSLFVYWPFIAFLHYRVVRWLSGSAYVGLLLLVLMPSPWFVYVAAYAYSA